MSAKENNIIGQLLKAIKETEKRQTAAYDSEATVRRIEGGTAWVHIPGGVDETPVKLTIDAKTGDTVQVRVSGGRAFLVGNATAPPTDDRVARQAVNQIKTVSKTVNKVQADLDKTSRVAGNTNQYFWHVSEGTDTGAHITEVTREEFLADPANGGGNLLARSNGVAIRDGLTELAGFLADSFFVGTDANTKISYDTINGLRLGQNVSLSPSGIFKMTYGRQGYGDYYEFSVDAANRYMYMNAVGNVMRIGSDGYTSIIESGSYYVDAPGTSITLMARHAMQLSQRAALYLAYTNGAAIAELTGTSDLRFTTSKGTVSANSLFKAAGDTWSDGYYGGGYVTSGGTTFRFSVPIPFVSGTLSITSLAVVVRQNGYMLGSASTRYTVPVANITVTKRTRFAQITFTVATAPTSIVNNDSVAIDANITFSVS